MDNLVRYAHRKSYFLKEYILRANQSSVKIRAICDGLLYPSAKDMSNCRFIVDAYFIFMGFVGFMGLWGLMGLGP